MNHNQGIVPFAIKSPYVTDTSLADTFQEFLLTTVTTSRHNAAMARNPENLKEDMEFQLMVTGCPKVFPNPKS